MSPILTLNVARASQGGTMEELKQAAACADAPALEFEKEGNWIEASLKTLQQMLFHPTSFFKGVGAGAGVKRPLLFSLALFYIMVMSAAAYQLGFHVFSGAAKRVTEHAAADAVAAILGLPVGILFLALFLIVGLPILSISGNLIKAGMYHICLLILGAATRDFTTTFRVVCYSSGIQVLQIVPVIGSIAAYIWGIALDLIGLREAHGTTTGKSLLAVFLPMLLCCSFLAIILFLIAGGVFAAVLKGW